MRILAIGTSIFSTPTITTFFSYGAVGSGGRGQRFLRGWPELIWQLCCFGLTKHTRDGRGAKSPAELAILWGLIGSSVPLRRLRLLPPASCYLLSFSVCNRLFLRFSMGIPILEPGLHPWGLTEPRFNAALHWGSTLQNTVSTFFEKAPWKETIQKR